MLMLLVSARLEDVATFLAVREIGLAFRLQGFYWTGWEVAPS